MISRLQLLTTMTISVIVAQKLPPDFKTCKLSDSNYNECLKNAINEDLSKLKNGLSNIGIPSVDPLYIPSMTIGEGRGAVHVTQKFTDINLHGISDTKVLEVDASGIRDLHLYVKSLSPYLKLQAKYSLNGRILLLPVRGEGDCTVTLYNVTVTHDSYGERFTKKGIEYKRLKKYTITLSPTKVEYNFENLFNGDKVLGENINRVMNDNWREVFDDVKPGYEESLGIIFGDYANKVYTRVPIDELFAE